jgi:hypothetical protein
MKLRSALQHKQNFTLGVTTAFITCVATTVALAVPLQNQDAYTTQQISLVGRSGDNVLMPMDVLNTQPVYVHGSTNITMGYIAAPGKDGCVGSSSAQKMVHGATNISMGYVSAPAAEDCIAVGSTGKTDREYVVALANGGRKAALRPRQTLNPTNVKSGGGDVGLGGGGSASSGGGSGGGGSGGGGSGGGGTGIPTFGSGIGTPSNGSGSNGGLGTPDSGSGSDDGLGGGKGATGAIPAVPLPETLPMMLVALAGLFTAARRKKSVTDI